MRVPRVYCQQVLSSGATLTLEGQESHYLSNVLRMGEGRELIVFCGDGLEYPARILSSRKKATEIELGQAQEDDRESPLHTHLALAISKGDRMDWALQKACELGVSAITPLNTERTEVRLKGERLDKKMKHWQQILISSCEQCQRNRLPVLNEALDIQAFINEAGQDSEALKLVLHHRSQKKLNDHSPSKKVILLVGPEGGLAADEITAAENAGFNPLTLGPRVLRTETAPIAVLSSLQLLWGDF